MSVLVLVSDAQEAGPLHYLASRLAESKEQPLIIVEVGEGLDEVEPQAFDENLAGISASVASVLKQSESVIECKVASLSHDDLSSKLLKLTASESASILIVGYHRSGALESDFVNEVFTKANCDTLMVRVNQQTNLETFRILVPVTGGMHSVSALRCGEKLARDGGKMVALYVESNSDELYLEVGEKRLQYLRQMAGIETEDFVENRVELAHDTEKKIIEVASEGFDLIIIGSSEVGSIRRNLFGTLPERMLNGPEGIALAVIRSRKPFIFRLQTKIEDLLDIAIPQITREERISLFEELELKSQWNFDFLILIILSTVIAALGLIQNSGAVVIGAMLVAPLMTPLLGTGLSLLQENSPLFKASSYAIGFGFLVAFCSSLLVGLLGGDSELSGQMLARTSPSSLDVLVGFLSGLAAAHCSARPGLSAALPGVAIAAALVPPIATAGLALAMGELSHTLGALLLFFTNIVAIVLGASASFFAGGVRRSRVEGRGRSWALQGSIVLLTSLVALHMFFISHPDLHISRVSKSTEDAITEMLRENAGELDDVRVLKSSKKLVLQISSPMPVTSAIKQNVLSLIEKELGAGVEVVIETKLVHKARTTGL